MLAEYCVMISVDVCACAQLTDRAMEALAQGTHLTLTALDISHCDNITEDSLGWLAGALGVSPKPCCKIQTLDASHCPGLRDKGLAWLGKTCTKLRYLNISNSTQFTSVGILGLYALKELRVMNIAHDDLIDDHGVMSIARSCPLLKSLNVK